MSRTHEPVPELLVERLALDDLDPATAAEVRTRLAATGSLERVAEIQASNRTILTAHPTEPVYAEVKRRLGRNEPRVAAPAPRARRWWPPLAVGTAALATVLVIARTDPGSQPGSVPSPVSEAGEAIRIKGLRPHLVIYKKTPAGAARLDDRSRVHKGDTIQVAYVAAGRRFGVVAAQDARGSVTLLLPTNGTGAAPLAERGETATANAFELDDSPGFERFVFVTSNQPFSASLVLEALRAQGETKLPPGASMTETVLSKEVR